MVKKDVALAGIDMIIAIVAIIIFSIFIITLMGNNAIENVKLAKETLAMIYITEIFENIGIEENFEQITEEYVYTLVPDKVKDSYDVSIIVDEEFDEVPQNQENKIIKKITATLTYEVKNKKYTCSMERLKVKE